ncbi:PQQ-dependent dehydrogenase, methanol/ethanol family [Kineobactrum sediminis]|uniref:PQQ-dependent dehydrogenase, methanol/ethanol family n=1 Tax=Kineobactrum sediminis TaxID=1905677 RepID=A0A2N5Y735_9GAMM|nr:PQQ-dependent dehydrogenase, methanol/ethanol family [Kineobactrum sediminis]PLW84197.1 PQQ-dependent dehydrogenase, methanol/ethanol family [Kineobactrum sediminis]
MRHALLSAALLYLASAIAIAAPVSEERLLAAHEEGDNWLSHGRTYSEQRFSPLAQVHDGNVDQLGLAWFFETDTHLGMEATPLVIDGVLYISGAWNTVWALDAKSGQRLWKFDPEIPREKSISACCGVINRGLAAWGDALYIGTLDGRLIAIDRATGEQLWSQQTTDPDQPYSITGAPRVAKGKVFIGNGGSEFGIRGYVSAYDADTGEFAWRFYTVPGNPADGFESEAMERAAATWSGEWWRQGGGGTVWDSIVYDPELDQLYIGVGNGAPHNRRIRSPGGGDNLFLSSIVALDPDTGDYLWHYQEVPAESWDYTATQQITLAEIPWEGAARKVILHAPKAGFVYVIDRASGKLLSAEPFTTVTWASHYDLETGRPAEVPGQDYDGKAAMVYPSAMGGHNWHPMAYSPDTGLMYIPELDMGMLYDEIEPVDYRHLKRHFNTGYKLNHDGYSQRFTQALLEHLPKASLLAWDPVKQEAAWKLPHPNIHNGGVLATAGNLVFQGTSDGRMLAVQADNGEPLWSFATDNSVMAGPVSYRVDGEQYIAVAVGRGGALTMNTGRSYPTGNPNNRIMAFKLNGSAALPQTPEVARLEPPQRLDVSATDLAEGRQLFNRYCARCHGADVSGDGSIPDLRNLEPVWHENFEAVVLEGLMEEAGMPHFADVLDKDQTRKIHAYIIERSHEDFNLRQETGWLQSLRDFGADISARALAWFIRFTTG